MVIKRSLTTMQIMQFLVGASYAMIHSFVSYTVPVASTYTQAATDLVSATATDVADTAEATPTAALLDSLKQIVFGVASKVASAAESTVSQVSGKPSPAVDEITETMYSQKLVPCIDNTGQTFAIWLNVLYLAPLTYLFVKFFITSYLRRSGAESQRAKGKGSRESQVSVAEKAGWDAARNLEGEIYGTPGENGNGKEKSRLTNGHAANSRTMRSVTRRA